MVYLFSTLLMTVSHLFHPFVLSVFCIDHTGWCVCSPLLSHLSIYMFLFISAVPCCIFTAILSIFLALASCLLLILSFHSFIFFAFISLSLWCFSFLSFFFSVTLSYFLLCPQHTKQKFCDYFSSREMLDTETVATTSACCHDNSLSV